jgi:hypothetical protein
LNDAVIAEFITCNIKHADALRSEFGHVAFACITEQWTRLADVVPKPGAHGWAKVLVQFIEIS